MRNTKIPSKDWENIELFELGQVSTKIQCPSCAKYWPEGLLCTCGICLRPSKEQKRKMKDQFEILSIPQYIVKKNCSRGAKHGRTQEQYDHFKANESTRHAKKKYLLSITDRIQRDEFYRHSQLAIGWTEEHCQHLDSLMSTDFSHTPTKKERELHENNHTLGVNNQRPKTGPMKITAKLPTK